MSDLVTIGYPDVEAAHEVLRALGALELRTHALAVHDTVVLLRRADWRVEVQPWVHLAALETAPAR